MAIFHYLNYPTFTGTFEEAPHVKNPKIKLHNSNGPTIVTEDGKFFWFRNGLMDRDDGPAYYDSKGTEEWWKSGEYHRVGGPALVVREYSLDTYTKMYEKNLTQEYWLQNSKFHRDDDAAIILYKNEKIIAKEYYIRDFLIEEDLFLKLKDTTNKEDLVEYLLDNNDGVRWLAESLVQKLEKESIV